MFFIRFHLLLHSRLPLLFFYYDSFLDWLHCNQRKTYFHFQCTNLFFLEFTFPFFFVFLFHFNPFWVGISTEWAVYMQ